MLEAYYSKTHIFKMDSSVPEVKLYNGIKDEQKRSLALFYTIALDFMRQSEFVYRAGKNLALEYDIDDLANMRIEHIGFVIARIMDNGVGNPAKILHDCAKKLKKNYEGDPRNIFRYENVKTTRKILQEFYGIGKGKSALILKNFQRFGYSNFNNSEIPIKIDRHAIRLSIGNGAVKIIPDEDFTGNIHIGKIVNSGGVFLEDIFNKICLDKGYNAIDLDDAKWIIGARVCKKKSRIACRDLCPLDCEALVKMNKSGSYIEYPSELRPLLDTRYVYKQMEMFD